MVLSDALQRRVLRASFVSILLLLVRQAWQSVEQHRYWLRTLILWRCMQVAHLSMVSQPFNIGTDFMAALLGAAQLHPLA